MCELHSYQWRQSIFSIQLQTTVNFIVDGQPKADTSEINGSMSEHDSATVDCFILFGLLTNKKLSNQCKAVCIDTKALAIQPSDYNKVRFKRRSIKCWLKFHLQGLKRTDFIPLPRNYDPSLYFRPHPKITLQKLTTEEYNSQFRETKFTDSTMPKTPSDDIDGDLATKTSAMKLNSNVKFNDIGHPYLAQTTIQLPMSSRRVCIRPVRVQKYSSGARMKVLSFRIFTFAQSNGLFTRSMPKWRSLLMSFACTTRFLVQQRLTCTRLASVARWASTSSSRYCHLWRKKKYTHVCSRDG